MVEVKKLRTTDGIVCWGTIFSAIGCHGWGGWFDAAHDAGMASMEFIFSVTGELPAKPEGFLVTCLSILEWR